MRWPWQRREVREAEVSYTDLVSRLIAAQADGVTAQATATAAVEAAAGLLSRTFAAAEVQGPGWVRDAVNPRVLAQIGRDLVRVGETLHVIRMDTAGHVNLVPASTWYWKGGVDRASWRCTATAYGPSGSETWRLGLDSVGFPRLGQRHGPAVPWPAPNGLGGCHGKAQRRS